MGEHNFDPAVILHGEILKQIRSWKSIAFILIGILSLETILLFFLGVKLSEKREVVRYVEFSTKGDFGFKVLPESNLNLSERKLLIEQQLKNYVSYRVANVTAKKYDQNGENGIDSNQVKFVIALNSKDVNAQYQSEMMRIYNEGDFISRNIHIFSYSEIEDRKYRFDFETIDKLENGQEIRNRWVVYIKYELIDPNDQKLNEHKELNPLGVKVIFYRGDIDTQQNMRVEDAANQ